MDENTKECQFCYEYEHKETSVPNQPFRILFESKYFWVKFSLYPVTPIHLLIISKRHILKMTDMNIAELLDFFEAKKRIEQWYRNDQGVENWIEGANYGVYAGQTVYHFHYHYFDRYKGDVENPKGGIRNFKPPFEKLGG